LTKSPACAVFTASFANASAIVAKFVVNTGVGTEPVLITPTKAKAMIEKHSTGHIPVMVSATDFTTVALAMHQYLVFP
jgi:hypothetical protein